MQHTTINKTINHLFIKIDNSKKDKSKKAKIIMCISVIIVGLLLEIEYVIFVTRAAALPAW